MKIANCLFHDHHSTSPCGKSIPPFLYSQGWQMRRDMEITGQRGRLGKRVTSADVLELMDGDNPPGNNNYAVEGNTMTSVDE